MNNDLDGPLAGRRTRGLTEELHRSPDGDAVHLWDSYGIDNDILVRVQVSTEWDIKLTTCIAFYARLSSGRHPRNAIPRPPSSGH